MYGEFPHPNQLDVLSGGICPPQMDPKKKGAFFLEGWEVLKNFEGNLVCLSSNVLSKAGQHCDYFQKYSFLFRSFKVLWSLPYTISHFILRVPALFVQLVRSPPCYFSFPAEKDVSNFCPVATCFSGWANYTSDNDTLTLLVVKFKWVSSPNGECSISGGLQAPAFE